jgi:hypothetical protein
MRLFNRIFDTFPRASASKLERLLWFRGYYLRGLPLLALGIGAVLALGVNAPHLWIAALAMLPWVVGFARLNVEIRNEKRRAQS